MSRNRPLPPRSSTRPRTAFHIPSASWYSSISRGCSPSNTRLKSAGRHQAIYDAAEVNKATAVAYEDLLESLLVAEAVPAWRSNRLKRLVHQPKRYLVDPALIAAALRTEVAGVMRDGDLLGRVLDTFVAAQLRPELAVSARRPRLHHLRTEQGRHEVDLLGELAGGQLIGIEVKASASPTGRDARHLAWLARRAGRALRGGRFAAHGPAPVRTGREDRRGADLRALGVVQSECPRPYCALTYPPALVSSPIEPTAVAFWLLSFSPSAVDSELNSTLEAVFV